MHPPKNVFFGRKKFDRTNFGRKKIDRIFIGQNVSAENFRPNIFRPNKFRPKIFGRTFSAEIFSAVFRPKQIRPKIVRPNNFRLIFFVSARFSGLGNRCMAFWPSFGGCMEKRTSTAQKYVRRHPKDQLSPPEHFPTF